MTAQYHLRIKVVSRTKGARATAAAAYRAGERIRDRRMSAVDDFSDRKDVVYKEIVLPAEWDNCAEMSWARDRETLWNTAELTNKRCDARVAREVLVLLPYEMTPGQRVELVALVRPLPSRAGAMATSGKHRTRKMRRRPSLTSSRKAPHLTPQAANLRQI